MSFDIEIIRSFYSELPGKIGKIRQQLGRPLTLSEKILFSHFGGGSAGLNLNRGKANSIIHSFNRNFSKRADGNPNTNAFIASPEIVAALSFAGDLRFDPRRDFIVNSARRLAKLAEPMADSPLQINHNEDPAGYQKPSAGKPKTEIKIDPDSERLRNLQMP